MPITPDLESIIEEIVDLDLTDEEEDFVNGLIEGMDEGHTLTYAEINRLEEIYDEAVMR